MSIKTKYHLVNLVWLTLFAMHTLTGSALLFIAGLLLFTCLWWRVILSDPSNHRPLTTRDAIIFTFVCGPILLLALLAVWLLPANVANHPAMTIIPLALVVSLFFTSWLQDRRIARKLRVAGSVGVAGGGGEMK